MLIVLLASMVTGMSVAMVILRPKERAPWVAGRVTLVSGLFGLTVAQLWSNPSDVMSWLVWLLSLFALGLSVTDLVGYSSKQASPSSTLQPKE